MDPLETPALRRQLLDELVSEAIEHLDAADALLDAIEHGGLTDDARDGLMRAMHTIKGAAGYMGLADIQRLAHALESVAQQYTADGDAAAVRRDLLLAGTAELRDLVAHADAPRPAAAGLLAALRAADVPPATPPVPRRLSVAEIFLDVVRQQCLALRAALPRLSQPEGSANATEGHRMARRALASLRSAAAYAGREDVLLLLDATLGGDPDAPPSTDAILHLLGGLAAVGGDAPVDPAADTAAAGTPPDRAGEGMRPVTGNGRLGKSVRQVTGNGRLDSSEVPGASALPGPSISPPSKDATGTPSNDAAGTLRVPHARVDALINQVGELSAIGRQLDHFMGQVEGDGSNPSLTRQGRLLAAALGRAVDDLQNTAHELRLVRLDTVFRRLPRICRDAAARTTKQVRLELLGGDIELDKTVAEALVDPLLHLIRNAVDHGIERPGERRDVGKPEIGVVVVAARQGLAEVIIDVRDDGRGVDQQRVRDRAVDSGLLDAEAAAALSSDDVLDLLFRPGLSTAAAVTDISGRGVGLDVVRANVARLGGKVTIRQLSPGTAFELRLPIRLAATDVVLVRAGGAPFAVALDGVLETLSVGADRVHRVAGRPAIVHQGRVVPLVSLAEIVGLGDGATVGAGGGELIVVDVAGRPVGLAVDEIDRHQKVVAKPLAGYVARPGLSNAAVLGDGTVVLVVSPERLIAWALAAPPAAH